MTCQYALFFQLLILPYLVIDKTKQNNIKQRFISSKIVILNIWNKKKKKKKNF